MTILWPFVTASAFHLVSVPYDGGANRRGSSRAVDFMWPLLKDKITRRVDVMTDGAEPSVIFGALRDVLTPLLDASIVPVVIGGDHTISVGSVGASYAHSLEREARLGVLWIDAHADFNTMVSSPTRNLHGMPVAILCGHTLPSMRGETPVMHPSQFAYLGVRDVDPVERERMDQHAMHELSVDDVEGWLKTIDSLHVSLDVDSVYHEALSVNTLVPGGIPMDALLDVLRLAHLSGKLVCADIVEFNPTVRDASFTADMISAMITTITTGQSNQ